MGDVRILSSKLTQRALYTLAALASTFFAGTRKPSEHPGRFTASKSRRNSSFTETVRRNGRENPNPTKTIIHSDDAEVAASFSSTMTMSSMVIYCGAT